MTPEEALAKVQSMSETDRIAVNLKAEYDPMFRNKIDKMQGIFPCWNCGRAIQKPAFASQVKGKGTNTMRLKCQCGKYTDVKF